MVQMAMGMMGFFVVHPRDPAERRVDRDFVWLLNLSPWRATMGSMPGQTRLLKHHMFMSSIVLTLGTYRLAPERLRHRGRVLRAQGQHDARHEHVVLQQPGRASC
jgi:FtsP/CotA-like multicopper oxidase with cupredoxin domain